MSITEYLLFLVFLAAFAFAMGWNYRPTLRPTPPSRVQEVPPDGETRFWLGSMEVDEDVFELCMDLDREAREIQKRYD